jgi:hypothetical protein
LACKKDGGHAKVVRKREKDIPRNLRIEEKFLPLQRFFRSWFLVGNEEAPVLSDRGFNYYVCMERKFNS